MNDYIMSECSTCGTTWVTGRYAHHSCTAKLVSDNDALTARVAELEAALHKIIKLDEAIHCFEDGETQICNVASKALENKS
jgi:hypothetical protein